VRLRHTPPPLSLELEGGGRGWTRGERRLGFRGECRHRHLLGIPRPILSSPPPSSPKRRRVSTVGPVGIAGPNGRPRFVGPHQWRLKRPPTPLPRKEAIIAHHHEVEYCIGELATSLLLTELPSKLNTPPLCIREMGSSHLPKINCYQDLIRRF